MTERRKLIANIVRDGFAVLTGDKAAFTSAIAEPSVSELLHHMETVRIEFKATARAPLNPDIPESVINEGIIKTVAAFMNTEGGTLGIGISDDGDVMGIQSDLDYKKQDLDSYQNWLMTLLLNAIGSASISRNVNIRFATVDGKVVCLLDIARSTTPAYANTVKGKEVFYVRVGNTTRIFTGSEMVKYITDNF